MAVRHALMEVDGVVSADVSYEREKAEIRYHPDLTNPEEMRFLSRMYARRIGSREP